MAQPLFSDPRLAWMDGDVIRPYVYLRGRNAIASPGRYPLDWFPFAPILKDPQTMAEEDFSTQILNLENNVFAGANLAMPRWVFYDCAIMPGITAGFVMRRSAAPASVIKITQPSVTSEWVPLSLFIIIPTMTPGEWVAHNLSSINSALPVAERYYGLGFLSKAFGLWYGNIEICCGMTQWRSPSLRLHSHYGDMEVETAYTPSHTYAQTLTYRLRVNPSEWHRFFTDQHSPRFQNEYRSAGFTVDRSQEESLKAFQRRLEADEGPYYLDASEIAIKPLDSVLSIYTPRG